MGSLIRLTILISGNGTNLQAVIDQIEAKRLPATIVRVISNRKGAYGLERAKRAGIPTLYHNLLSYKKVHPSTEQGVQAAREEYDTDLAQLVLQDRPALVVCLGFLHVLTRSFLDPIEKAQVKIINLHPALPSAFSGSNAIERAHSAWMEGHISSTGIMIHNVVAEVDMGTPILVREIPFVKGVDEDLQVLEQRIHEVEWKAVPEGIKIAIGQLRDERNPNLHAHEDLEEAGPDDHSDAPI